MLRPAIHRARRVGARAAVAAALITVSLLAFACGDSSSPAATPTAGPSTTRPSTQVPPSSPTGTAEPTSAPEPDRVTVQVYFLNERNFQSGTQPFVTAVEREVEPPAVAQGALQALFSGPTQEEQAQGLRFEASGATGFEDLRIEDGTARVRLTGSCDSRGSTFTIAQEIIPTLTQFESVEYVKIYAPDGTTESPDGPGNSIPACLEP